MNKKYFVIGGKNELAKDDILQIEKSRNKTINTAYLNKEKINSKKQSSKVGIKAMEGFAIVSVDTDGKNFHTFAGGLKIRLERQYNNFDVKDTQQTSGTVVHCENIPEGATVLFHPNSTHDTYKINNYEQLSGETEPSTVHLYRIPEEQIFLWKTEDTDWQPTKNFVTALRVFKPYSGILVGIEPTKIKNVLYILNGELKGKCVHTLIAADYEIIFNDTDGKEHRKIRCRHSDTEEIERQEIVMVDHYLTREVEIGNLLIGVNWSTAKKVIK
jgi:hypothetical protein